MKRLSPLAVLVTLLLCISSADRAVGDTFGSGANTFDIDFVTIGNPGNAADTEIMTCCFSNGTTTGFGVVPYSYRMDKFEISEQMIDKANTLGGLFINHIIRGADKPATAMTWNEAARFVNWLNTSTGSTPAYKFATQPGEPGYVTWQDILLWAPTDPGYNPNNLYRNSLARYFLPSVDEWYKAAYYDPTSDVYYDYPTGSNAAPTPVASGTAAGTAVYNGQAGPANITLAGGLSPYGTMGQGGNAYEFGETASDLLNNSSSAGRIYRGSDWINGPGLGLNFMLSSIWLALLPGDRGGSLGFRVASSIPEPSTLLLLCFGSLAVLWRRRGLLCASILAAAVGATFADRAAAVTIDMVTVGNPGNAPDTPYAGNPTPVGSVAYAYQIGKYEVTAGQYTVFLNAVAKADPNGLYNTAMGDPVGSLGANIQRTGSSPNFSYSVAADWANRPVNYVSFWNATRFANWLHNGQPSGAQGPGTTEGGAYHDVGSQLLFDRNAGAKFFIPTEDEWYKAAYHDKTAGLAASYFGGPMGRHDGPYGPGHDITEATNPGNNANFRDQFDVFAIGPPYYRTEVGEFELSASPYGTFDQGGNVSEWTETLNVVRGGSFIEYGYFMGANSHEIFGFPGGLFVGFRVASIAVPEPSTILLLGFGAAAAIVMRLRFMRARWLPAVVIVALFCAAPRIAHAVTIDLVPVGNPGNAPDLRYNLSFRPEGFGSVGYNFQIGKYEVTAGQYTQFLNAVAKADPNALYNGVMGYGSGGGANIQRTGSSPNYNYSVAADWANRPVNYVSFWDAARFANWLHNGQPTGAQGPGTTEGGAYHDVGDQTLFGRNAGAKFFIPTEDEWYKAAYHNKYAGLAARYFDYPTGNNILPGGDITETTDPGNNANYYFSGYVIGSPYYRTVVGEFELSGSPYGTFDQGGNVQEWNETVSIDGFYSYRGRRGGSWYSSYGLLHASFRNNIFPAVENSDVGFRVASIAVPEPSTILLLGFGAAAAIVMRRRFVRARRLPAVVIIALFSAAPGIAHAAPITVPVGNAGNPPDQNYAGQGQFGAVPYGYRIAIHEVTNTEYAAFLNAKVSISYDPFFPVPPTFGDSWALLNESMLYGSRGGLTAVLPTPCAFNCGAPGGPLPPPQPPAHFEARVNMGDKPVNFVSWYDAVRYANWLNNGQSFSSTETGAYTLGPLGASGIPLDPNAVTRNPGATWVLPNEDEWYKAAYYQPAAVGGDSDGYWLSPTRSNVTSAVYATADSTGNISNPGANVMNESGANWYGLTGNVTTVGSAGPLSASYYGTFDQGGNVQEWLESVASGGRIVRGGSWDGANNIGFRADQRTNLSATYEDADVGFRVAQLAPIVPEPATVALAALGLLGLATCRRRRERMKSSAHLDNRKGTPMNRFARQVSMALALSLSATLQHAQAITIDMVTVGNPGNAPDTRYNSISVGSVAYAYQIGKYEVTAGQYTQFLNAVAKADPNGLYNTSMGSIPSAGANIQRTGSSPNFSYSVAVDWADRPVNYVSFWDAARFANWLNNGQPTGAQGPGTTEGGAYHDVGNQTLFGRNAGAQFFIPTENEWYKAAYHKNDGVTGNYWDWPTASNTGPINTLPDPGNHANFYDDPGTGNTGNNTYTIGSPYYRTNVGEFVNSASPYGTFDQGGNVAEWNETVLFGSFRGVRGGSFDNNSGLLPASDAANYGFPTFEGDIVGFRVASVPELPGDFNHDGTVDAADYVVWRKNPGGSPDDYNTWRANFGRTFFTPGSGAIGTASASTSTVPEPASLVLLLLSGIALTMLPRVRVAAKNRC